jgi:hypothetical protein
VERGKDCNSSGSEDGDKTYNEPERHK